MRPDKATFGRSREVLGINTVFPYLSHSRNHAKKQPMMTMQLMVRLTSKAPVTDSPESSILKQFQPTPCPTYSQLYCKSSDALAAPHLDCPNARHLQRQRARWMDLLTISVRRRLVPRKRSLKLPFLDSN